MPEPDKKGGPSIAGRVLDSIEWLGNKLPDPTVLFLLGAILVMVVSHFTAPVLDDAGQVVRERWVVQPKMPVQQTDPETGQTELVLMDTGEPERASSLLTREGFYWAMSNMVRNFVSFPPLGVVLTGMLGIGVAERTGLIAALLRTFMQVVPRNMLTPTMVFLGIMSSLGMDAGYVVLPPLAAALYLSVGRSPLAGIAAVFAGVSAGFNANLLVTGLDPMLAEFTTAGGRIIDPEFEMAPTANWWFMIVSTFVITGAGWMTTALFVERRLSRRPAEEGGPDPSKVEPTLPSAWTPWTIVAVLAGTILYAGLLVPWLPNSERLESARLSLGLTMTLVTVLSVVGVPLFMYRLARGALEHREAVGIGLATAGLTGVPCLAAILSVTPGWVLWDDPAVESSFPRWVTIIVPLILLTFLIPGLIYGAVVGKVKNGKDAAKFMIEAIAAMAPIIVLSFFAAQFIEYFTYSNLGRMLAFSGGEWLFEMRMPVWLLLVAFIGVTMVFNLFMGSMSAKYALFAPIFVPMFMLIGIRPELTQVAYRIGDSVTNIITPLNAYLIILLVFMQKYMPKAGMGTLIAMMLPYSIVFAIIWTLLLIVWVGLGWSLGLGDSMMGVQ